jgi:transcriptional regulator of acetoin/glycerol metabolism
MDEDRKAHLVDCSATGGGVPPEMTDDLELAAAVDVPVLLSGPPAECQELACELDRRSGSRDGTVEVVDCRQRGALAMFRQRTAERMTRCDLARCRILLLQEVHALSPGDQALLARRLEEVQRVRAAARVRIVASSSVPLFDRVVDNLFDEHLFYRLNVIHIVVPLAR